MTRDEVLKLARSMDERERYNIWKKKCPSPHVLKDLPKTDSGEYYCENCCGVWKPNGEMLNAPTAPQGLSTRRLEDSAS